MRVLAGCDNRNCPKVIEDDNGDFVVQGDTVPAADLIGLPDGENRVRVPRALLVDLAAQLTEQPREVA